MTAARASRSSATADLPEPDRQPGAPHPRETPRLFGQEAAEAAFLSAHAAGRAHHAWLITGPRGIGKATLAWRIARFLLATPIPAAPYPQAAAPGLFGDAEPPPTAPPATLDPAPDDPVARRLQALSEPRLMLIRRGPNQKGDKLSAMISVSEVRRLREFFGMSATDGGARVVIIDAADEMNAAAANAVLKLLEEPPANATLLLVSHQPAGLLPTIRSRCRVLRLSPLDAAPMQAALAQAGADPGRAEAAALAELAEGSVGVALALVLQDGLALYARLIDTLADLPRLDRAKLARLAQDAGSSGAEGLQPLFWDLCERMLARLARSGAAGPPVVEAAPGEAMLFSRLCPDAASARNWAAAQQLLGHRARAGLAVNLDPASLVLDMWLGIEAASTGRPVAP